MTSRAIPVTVPFGGNSIIRRAGRLTLAAVATLARMLKARRDVAELARFDEHMLRDIGLTRANVDAALGQPWRCDPSSVLNQRAAERWAQSLTRLRQRQAATANAERKPVVARYI